MHIRQREAADRAAVEEFLARWNALQAARRGVVERPLDHPALIAEDNERLLGVLTYVVDELQCEVLTLHVDESGRGIGTALIAEVTDIAARAGCARLWVVTTNDNVDALRFYQGRGFRLAALHPGAVDVSRARLKPEIPTVGNHGIPLRDELELEQPVVAVQPRP
jgi:ribosomal protein S18 acetylase RimI-like enzyme